MWWHRSGQSASVSDRNSQKWQWVSPGERMKFTVDSAGPVIHDGCKYFPCGTADELYTEYRWILNTLHFHKLCRFVKLHLFSGIWRFHLRLYWIIINFSNSMTAFLPVVVPCRLKHLRHFKRGTDFSNKQLNSIGNICQLIKNQGKSLKIICLVF